MRFNSPIVKFALVPLMGVAPALSLALPDAGSNLVSSSLLSKGLEAVGLESAMKSVRMQRTALEVEKVHLEGLRGALELGHKVDKVIVEEAPGYTSVARGGVLVGLGMLDTVALYQMRNLIFNMMTLKSARTSFRTHLNSGPNATATTKALRFPSAVLRFVGRGAVTLVGAAATASFIYGVGFVQFHGMDALYLNEADYKTLIMNTDLRIAQVQRQQEELQRSIAQLEIESQRRAQMAASKASDAATGRTPVPESAPNSSVFKIED